MAEQQEEPKTKWPEAVDKDGEEAKVMILAERPGLNVLIIKDGTPVTRDYRMNRVRVVVNEEGKVVRAPFCA